MRRWVPFLAALVLTGLASSAATAGGAWWFGRAAHGRHGIDRYYAVAGIALMHDGCDQILAGWHLSWGQPVRLDDCRSAGDRR